MNLYALISFLAGEIASRDQMIVQLRQQIKELEAKSNEAADQV